MRINISEYKQVILNFINLAFVQAANLLLPLITIPYVIRTVGFENFGLVAFATSIVNYFSVFINYGFNLTATKAVSQNRNDSHYLNKLFCTVTYSKVLLSFTSILIFLVLSILIVSIKNNFYVYLYLLLSIIFTNLSPDWFFQGIQQLKFLTYLNLSLKIISTILTFFLIKVTSDYYYLAIIPFINSVFLFAISHLYIQIKHKFRYLRVDLSSIFKELYQSRFIFLSQVKITFFNNFNTVVLGFLTDNKIVGIFSSADKIIKVFSSIQVPIVTALFPHIAMKIKNSRETVFYELKKIAIYGSVLYGAILIILFILAPWISQIMFGAEVDQIALLIRIMSFIPLFIFINNLFGTQYLLNTGLEKKFLINLIIAALLNVVIIFPLTYYFKAIGTSFSIFITELFVLISMYNSAKKVNATLKI
ncbi:oligosaccharide flippase family protein [Epilithonimonas vandammei]|uniref:oligosaccharide flippase family protein n=1 Tax=Epilithonimonas vandammei TaxID=2487072 RepID=UPI0028ACBDB0|nr:oligosaccharide flippase family protein [Epilithonimonas vandammei]